MSKLAVVTPALQTPLRTLAGDPWHRQSAGGKSPRTLDAYQQHHGKQVLCGGHCHRKRRPSWIDAAEARLPGSLRAPSVTPGDGKQQAELGSAHGR